MSTISDVERVAAIEQAYRDGYRRFLSLALGMLGDVDRARDAVQEAFAHALRHRGDLREAESLNAWLWRIVVNVCRVEKRHPVIGLDDSCELEAAGRPGDWLEVRAVIAGPLMGATRKRTRSSSDSMHDPTALGGTTVLSLERSRGRTQLRSY